MIEARSRIELAWVRDGRLLTWDHPPASASISRTPLRGRLYSPTDQGICAGHLRYVPMGHRASVPSCCPVVSINFRNTFPARAQARRRWSTTMAYELRVTEKSEL
eukprot:6751866-Prymnesium_polylepis.1